MDPVYFYGIYVITSVCISIVRVKSTFNLGYSNILLYVKSEPYGNFAIHCLHG